MLAGVSSQADGEGHGRAHAEVPAGSVVSSTESAVRDELISFVDALREKYDPINDSTDEHGEESGAVVMFVARGLNSLRSASLRRCRIGTAGVFDPGLRLTRLSDIDIAHNPIQWGSVHLLVGNLPGLRSLNLTGCRDLGSLWASTAAEGIGSAAALRTLILNDSGISWSDVCILLQCLPALTELSLSGNALKGVQLTGDAKLHPALTTLRLDRNRIDSWTDVSTGLGQLPVLDALVLSENPIPSVRMQEADTDEATRFRRLRALYLSKTALSSWTDIDALSQLPALRELSISGIPLGEDLEPDVRRMLLIAHLPNVSAGGCGKQTVGSETAGLLNRSAITCEERRAAEQFRKRWESGAFAAFRGQLAASLEADGRSVAHGDIVAAAAAKYMLGGLEHSTGVERDADTGNSAYTAGGAGGGAHASTDGVPHARADWLMQMRMNRPGLG